MNIDYWKVRAFFEDELCFHERDARELANLYIAMHEEEEVSLYELWGLAEEVLASRITRFSEYVDVAWGF